MTIYTYSRRTPAADAAIEALSREWVELFTVWLDDLCAADPAVQQQQDARSARMDALRTEIEALEAGTVVAPAAR